MYYNHIHNDSFLTGHPILCFLLSVTFMYLGKWLLLGAWATYQWIVGLRAPRAFPDSIAIALGCLLEWNGYKILLLKTPYTLDTWLREINQNLAVSFLPAGSAGKYWYGSWRVGSALKSSAALPEDLSSIPSTQMAGQNCNFSSRWSDTFISMHKKKKALCRLLAEINHQWLVVWLGMDPMD